MTKTIEVTGRNGFIYDATHIKGNLYRVGRHVVVVADGRVVRNATAQDRR